MRKKVAIGAAIFLLVVLLGFQGVSYYVKYYNSAHIWGKIIKQDGYSVKVNDESTPVEFFIHPEWLSLNKDHSRKINVKVAEAFNTSIILREVTNQGKDFFFDFDTTYKLNDQRGQFLSNQILNGDGTVSSKSSPASSFEIFTVSGENINHGAYGRGPDSKFFFSVSSEDYDKFNHGFYVRYSGMMLYEYWKK